MTQKLYYENCHLSDFTAKVLSCTPVSGGYEVILDQTAFYPEGGGQPFDTGTLGTTAVLKVWEQGETVLHLCDAPLQSGDTVPGHVDMDRRFDLMQQHSGEHMLSGIIHRRYGYHNVGFHMGSDMITIDFDGMIPPEELASIELEANEAIWKNLPLHIWYPSPEELPGVFYRSKRALPWPVRVVEIPGVDSCACCGVHVACTGEIGLVKIFSCTKFHQGVRLEIACGGRALAHLSAVYEENRLVSQAFSAKILETGSAAQRMNDALAAEKYRCVGLERRLFEHITRSYVNQGNVLHFEADMSPASLRELAGRIAGVCGGTAALFSGNDDAGYSFCLASGTDDLRPLGKRLTQALNGRGGGKPDFIQGSLRSTKEEIQRFFLEEF